MIYFACEYAAEAAGGCGGGGDICPRRRRLSDSTSFCRSNHQVKRKRTTELYEYTNTSARDQPGRDECPVAVENSSSPRPSFCVLGCWLLGWPAPCPQFLAPPSPDYFKQTVYNTSIPSFPVPVSVSSNDDDDDFERHTASYAPPS